MALQMPNDAQLGLALQRGAGATDAIKLAAGYGQYTGSDASYNWYPFTDLSLAPVKNVDQLPPEIGGVALPTGQFTTGIWAEGPISLIPRLDNRFGWIMYAAMGQVSSVSNQKVEDLTLIGGAGTATTGVYTHIFSPILTDQYFIPWLSARRLLPHLTAGERVGEVFQDGRVATFTINGAAAAPVTVDTTFLARVKQSNYVFEINPSWSATYDDLSDFAVASCDGHVKINDVSYQATAVSINLVNQLLPPQQSLVIGSVTPVDFPNLQRQLTIAVTFLVENYDLYLSTFTGATVDASASSGENVACTIYQADVDVMLASQTAIGASGDTSEPFRLRVVSNQDADNVSWTPRPVRVVPNRPVVMQLIGTVTAASSGYPWFMMLQNGQAGYVLP